MNRYIQHLVRGIRSHLLGLPLLLIYNVLPIVGLVWLDWDPYTVAWIYWFEALIIMIYELAVAVRTGPQGEKSEKTRMLFFLGGFIFLTFQLMYQWMTYQFIADTILGYNAGEIGSPDRWGVLIEYISVVGIQVALVAVYYVMQFIRAIQDTTHAVRSTSLMKRWFTTAFLPLMMGLLIAQIADANTFLVVLIIVVIAKIIVDLWYQAGELPFLRGEDEFDLRRHPYAMFSVVQSMLLVSIALFCLIIVFPGRWDPNVSGTFNLVGFAILILIPTYFVIPHAVRVRFDRKEEVLHVEQKKIRRRQDIIPVQDIRRIARKKMENGQPGPWEVHLDGKKRVRIPQIYISQIELYDVLQYIQEQYSEIKVVIPKTRPDNHG